jgi:hypothetical protein
LASVSTAISDSGQSAASSHLDREAAAIGFAGYLKEQAIQ